MKFLYQYRTPDNSLCDGAVCAASRDAAYALLKKEGIKPARLVEAPGIFNKLFGKGKRWIAIGVLLVVAIFTGVVAVRQKTAEQERLEGELSPLTRRQIYGDPAYLEMIERSEFCGVFKCDGDRYLACFAQPARIHNFIHEDWQDRMVEALEKLFETSIEFAGDDKREVRELKRIVLWMRDEYRAYLSDGIGSPRQYIGRLIERQEQELKIYEYTAKDLQGSRDAERWEKKNQILRELGIRTIVPTFELE